MKQVVNPDGSTARAQVLHDCLSMCTDEKLMVVVLSYSVQESLV